jgi:hypothetical protein
VPKKFLKFFSFASLVLIIFWVTIFIERTSLAQRSSPPDIGNLAPKHFLVSPGEPRLLFCPSTSQEIPAPYYPTAPVIPSSPNIQRSPAPERSSFPPDGSEPRLLSFPPTMKTNDTCKGLKS